ncbi:hypothetical protein [Poriferisphaera sp. WC338]|uniref:hypothetical protein n=1 Tax=Poriferisphaera sp. WC338 TaxID=3425129 RepID=UPI003D8151FC
MSIAQYILWLAFAAFVVWRGVVILKRGGHFFAIAVFFLALFVVFEASMQFFNRDKLEAPESPMIEEAIVAPADTDHEALPPTGTPDNFKPQNHPQLVAPPEDHPSTDSP